MSDLRGRQRDILMDAASGLASGLLYLSFLLSFAFLLPVQRSLAARGRRSGLIAAGSSIVCIAAGQGARLSGYGVFDLGLCLASAAPPLLLLAALFFLDLRLWGLGAWTKILLASILLASAAAPFALGATGDRGFVDAVRSYVTAAAGGSGLDASALKGIDQSIAEAVATLRSAVAPMLFWLLGLSWLGGSGMAARDPRLSPEEREKRRSAFKLENYRAPQRALWPTLASWAFLFVALAAKLGGLLSILAWNLALLSASLYAVQGLGILGYLAERYPAARLVRLLLPLALIILVLSPTAGTILLAALPVLGITEVWFPYRNLKGALK